MLYDKIKIIRTRKQWECSCCGLEIKKGEICFYSRMIYFGYDDGCFLDENKFYFHLKCEKQMRLYERSEFSEIGRMVECDVCNRLTGINELSCRVQYQDWKNWPLYRYAFLCDECSEDIFCFKNDV